jgi:hypothetical protein
MNRSALAALCLLLPLLRAEDRPKPTDAKKRATPAAQYDALLDQYDKAMAAFRDVVGKAKSPDEMLKLYKDKNPNSTFAPKFLALAEKYPKDPIALDALVWVITDEVGFLAKNDVQGRAVELVVRHHIRSDKLGALCKSLQSGFDLRHDTLLRAILAKNPHQAVQIEASLALAATLVSRGAIVERIKDSPEMTEQMEQFLGKEQTRKLKKLDPAHLETQTEEAFQQLTDKYLAQVSLDQLRNLCQSLGSMATRGCDAFLRNLLEKDKRRDVRGLACLTLAQVLKRRADDLPAAKENQQEKIRAASEKLFERADRDFADVKLGINETVGAKAKSELYEMRHLAIGKQAPEIVGEDQDDKKFKLSDYRGKVVLLDFWNQF